MQDKFSRTIDYLRISVTDRCNMRCFYCMPDGVDLVPMSEILTYEEIISIVKAAAGCGIKKIKITGGEPLVRNGVVNLIKKLKNLSGIEQVTMTTNGVLLADFINELKKSGLDAVNISLDTLKPNLFEYITGFDFFDKVKEGINAALSSGIKTKINVVLHEGINFDEWENILQLAKNNPLYVRFIELMPIGEGKNKKFNPVSNLKLLSLISQKYKFEFESKNSVYGNGPAEYIKISGFEGKIGFISSLHKKFCSSCNRIRLTSQGKLKPCLCYSDFIDVKEIVRNYDGNIRQKYLEDALKKAVAMKPQQHCFEDIEKISESRLMSEIGG